MNFVFGRVAEFIRDRDGELKGLLLEGGREVRFPGALRECVSPIVTEGCSVAVEGVARTGDFPEGYLLATRVTNMDSQQSATLPALKHKGKPGMQLTNTPVDSASLAPLSSQLREECGPVPLPKLDDRSDSTEIENGDAAPLRPPSFFRSMLQQTDASGINFARNDSARSIGQAYDNLHRIQAILAYLHIMKHSVPGISQFLDEAKHTYVQALARFSATDFLGAKEFAKASGSLSRIVEIVMARTLRSDSTLPSLVPPPPDHISASPESVHVEEDLAHAESVLARIHWVLEHGTLPSEDRAQVRKIASWGDAFYKQAQHTYRNSVLEDASEFAQAALAGAYSAEHVCRKWYANHPASS
ncbi:MAG: hypothetical protein WAM58_10780 [Candidatus Acidiferrum sp.]